MVASAPFVTEPTFWTTSNAEQTGYNKPDRERVVVDEDGNRIKIKHPQAAHTGEYTAPVRLRGEGIRYISMVRRDGHVVFYTITSGAGDTDAHSDYARSRRIKASALGWFPLGACPVALLRSGQMRPDDFEARALLDAHPCQHGTYSLKNPCSHALAERDARVKIQVSTEVERERVASAKENKLVEAQRAQTDAIIKAQAESTERLVASLTAPKKGKSE